MIFSSFHLSKLLSVFTRISSSDVKAKFVNCAVAFSGTFLGIRILPCDLFEVIPHYKLISCSWPLTDQDNHFGLLLFIQIELFEFLEEYLLQKGHKQGCLVSCHITTAFTSANVEV